MATQLMLLGSAVLAVAAVPGVYWLARSRTARRVRSAANIYAARQIDRETRGKARKADLTHR